MKSGVCAVYILTNRPGGVLYTGVTSNLRGRLWQHRNEASTSGFSSRYNTYRLVYYDVTSDIGSAIAREKQIKGWSRAFKVRLIERDNPGWVDLSEGWT